MFLVCSAGVLATQHTQQWRATMTCCPQLQVIETSIHIDLYTLLCTQHLHSSSSVSKFSLDKLAKSDSKLHRVQTNAREQSPLSR